MIIQPPKEREVDRAIRVARRMGRHRTPRQAFLFAHARLGHRLEARDNHDHCSCGAVFYRPNHV